MTDMTNLQQLPGVGEGTAKKLKENGILTILGIAACTPGRLADTAGVSEATARKMISSARDLCQLGFMNAKDLEEKEIISKPYIPTHCAPIDKLLGGGLQLGTTMEA